MISNVISGIIFGLVYYFIFEDDLIETLLVTLGFIILSTLIEIVLVRMRKKRTSTEVVVADEGQVLDFVRAIGGSGNIESVSHEVSRVKVTLKDVDLIDQDQLNDLALEGAFLSGNQLQATFGKQAEYIAAKINEKL